MCLSNKYNGILVMGLSLLVIACPDAAVWSAYFQVLLKITYWDSLPNGSQKVEINQLAAH